MVLANRGDPIFGAIGRLLSRGVKAVRGIVTGFPRGQAETAIARTGTAGPALLARRAVAAGGALVRTKTARVVGGLVATGGAAAIGSRLGTPGGALARSDGFVVSPTGCPIAKVVQVSAHERLMPIDRFGKARRRINVLNTKALSRATRRLVGFQKRARRVEKSLARLAPRTRGRSRARKIC